MRPTDVCGVADCFREATPGQSPLTPKRVALIAQCLAGLLVLACNPATEAPPDARACEQCSDAGLVDGGAAADDDAGGSAVIEDSSRATSSELDAAASEATAEHQDTGPSQPVDGAPTSGDAAEVSLDSDGAVPEMDARQNSDAMDSSSFADTADSSDAEVSSEGGAVDGETDARDQDGSSDASTTHRFGIEDSPCDADAQVPARSESDQCRVWPLHQPLCYVPPRNCAALRESTYCLAFSERAIYYIGLDSGTVCRDSTAPLSPQVKIRRDTPSSFAYTGHDVVMCTDGIVQRLSLTDGSFAASNVGCVSVSDLGNSFVVSGTPGYPISEYRSWEDLVAGNGHSLARDEFSTVYGGYGDKIVSAFEGDNSVFIGNKDGSDVRKLTLQGFGGGIHGLTLLPDGDILVASGGISRFDGTTGAAKGTIANGGFSGLVCRRGYSESELARHPGWSGRSRRGYIDLWRPWTDYVVDLSRCWTGETTPFLPSTAGPELIIIAAPIFGTHTVRDERSTPHFLLLVARGDESATTLRLDLAAQANVQRIILTGNAHSAGQFHVEGTGSVPVEDQRNDVFGIPGRWASWDSERFRRNVEDHYGRTVVGMETACNGGLTTIRDVKPFCP